ncbi:imidazole glycerol phosphate synthase subunit HisH [Granulicella arctica]|uniref:imidazole glycerol phosphate synthase subunit HisH n=1 Tax=Granulicella arctica TaxID=940613 RepID=UPI0021E092A4|nr:imidazole glycerol phosphate synthase subunit HisH [Granulicella arctica]
MIAVIDYKAGNLTSVVKALTYLDAGEITVTQDPEVVLQASRIVLPGVGHFRSTQLLTDLGLTEATRQAIKKGSYFLGICVGLQWLFEGSTESDGTPGLGHFAGACERFPVRFEDAELKSPHVGWNSLEEVKNKSRLLRNIDTSSFVYYTHSWRAPLVSSTAAVTNYGGPFTAAVEHENVMGVQFHPEKSSAVGLQVLKNFVEL